MATDCNAVNPLESQAARVLRIRRADSARKPPFGNCIFGCIVGAVDNCARTSAYATRIFGQEKRVSWSSLVAKDHKVIGLRYLWLALVSVFLGMITSLVMRIQLLWPGPHFVASPDAYASLTLVHGSLMVFVVLTCAPQAGFGTYFLPTQIGASEMAFPKLTRLGFWLTLFSVVGMVAAFFYGAEAGLKLWLASVAVFCLGATLNALNFAVTTIDSRARGMTLPRLPVTVWAWFINAALSLLIFSTLIAACVLLVCDRAAATHFFVPPAANAASPVVAWQRLFWFFTQAQVYVAILPCLGIVTHLVATFARKPVFAHRGVVLSVCSVGVCGFWIWGEHAFAVGLNPYAPLIFSMLAISLSIPASVLLISWFATLWNAKPRFSTAMLFSLGFISLFVSGGLTGLLLARAKFPDASVGDALVSGHYHLVMGIAATFAMLAALFFWFPKMFGRALNERLGKLHFWLTLAGVYLLFIPMHWLGMISHLPQPAGVSAADSLVAALQLCITFATVITIAAQGVFVFNVALTLLRRADVRDTNPWRSASLEWAASATGSATLTVHRGAYEFFPRDIRGGGDDFFPQNAPPIDLVPPPLAFDPGAAPLNPLGST
jgi:cytochrome c oxidase subunit I